MIGYLAANTTTVSVPSIGLSSAAIFIIGFVLGVIVRGKF